MFKKGKRSRNSTPAADSTLDADASSANVASQKESSARSGATLRTVLLPPMRQERQCTLLNNALVEKRARRGIFMPGKGLKPKKYGEFLAEVKERIRSAQYEALRKVNKELIGLYWDIGKMIIERQKKYKWGKSVVENLAKDLQKEFPGVRGYSVQNLWYMRQFYAEYANNEILQPLVGEIAWAHNLAIMSRVKDPSEREFYIRMTKRMGWSKNVLIHQIDNGTYEKTLSSQTNFSKTLPTKIKNQAKLAVKDEYAFDFLELGEDHNEMELERALMSKVNRFLVEMGGVFAFMGNQFRIEINGKEFFVDILLYHRKLKCLVAIELKVGEFKPEYAGKMQFYLAAMDDNVRLRGENSSVGIILCKDKDRTVVEYAIRESKKPIAVSKYKITKKLPRKLREEMPAPEDIKNLFE